MVNTICEQIFPKQILPKKNSLDGKLLCCPSNNNTCIPNPSSCSSTNTLVRCHQIDELSNSTSGPCLRTDESAKNYCQNKGGFLCLKTQVDYVNDNTARSNLLKNIVEVSTIDERWSYPDKFCCNNGTDYLNSCHLIWYQTPNGSNNTASNISICNPDSWGAIDVDTFVSGKCFFGPAMGQDFNYSLNIQVEVCFTTNYLNEIIVVAAVGVIIVIGVVGYYIVYTKPFLGKSIGESNSKVYRGKWRLRTAAIKEICLPSDEKVRIEKIEKITNEINILKRLKNEHIIQYRGSCYRGSCSNNQKFFIIMDYAKNGTLTDFIRNIKVHDLVPNEKFISQMARGLNYIHQKGIVHRDIKSSNILLTNNYRQIKISDFGLAESKDAVRSTRSGPVGTLEWMAPEALKKKEYSKHSDIYSLGVVIWQIVAKCTTPFKEFDDYKLLALHISEGGKEEIPNDTPANIRDIIEGCWKTSPHERITLENILKMIEGVGLKPQDVNTTSLIQNLEDDEPCYSDEELKLDIYNQEWFTTFPELSPEKDLGFISWLKNEKSKDIEDFAEPQWVKNNAEINALKSEYEQFQNDQIEVVVGDQQVHIQVPPKGKK